jgi:excisionase family DNA binding protein
MTRRHRTRAHSANDPYIAVLPSRPLTIKEAAQACGRSESTIRRLIDAKRLRAAKLGGKWSLTTADINAAFARGLNTEDA